METTETTPAADPADAVTGPQGAGAAQGPCPARRASDRCVPGAGRLVAFCAIAACAVLMPWYAPRVATGGADLSATGMQTDYGYLCLFAMLAAIIPTWAEAVGALPRQRGPLLLLALIGTGIGFVGYALQWADARGPIFDALVSTTPWFYAGIGSAFASTWFAFKRLRQCSQSAIRRR